MEVPTRKNAPKGVHTRKNTKRRFNGVPSARSPGSTALLTVQATPGISATWAFTCGSAKLRWVTLSEAFLRVRTLNMRVGARFLGGCRGGWCWHGGGFPRERRRLRALRLAPPFR